MKNHSKNFLTVVIAVLAVSTLGAGCSRMSYLRQARDSVDYTAVPSMRYSQTMNPEAGKNRKVVAGLDSTVAKNINDNYAKSFVKQDATQQDANTVFLGLSGVSND